MPSEVILFLPQIIIFAVFGLLFSTCLWAYLKEKKKGRGTVRPKDVALFLVKAIGYGGGTLVLLVIIWLVIYYAGGGH